MIPGLRRHVPAVQQSDNADELSRRPGASRPTSIGSVLLLACGLLLALSPVARSREWADNTGKYSVEAELVEVRGDRVVLKKPDGAVITVKIEGSGWS